MKITTLLSKITTVAWFVFALSLIIFLINIIPASYKAGYINGSALAGAAGSGDSTEPILQIEVSPGYSGIIAIATGAIALIGTLSKTFSDVATARIVLKAEREKLEVEKIRREMQLREVEILKLELEKERLEQLNKKRKKSP